ncbi:MAG: 50S ribosomal protein L4 [Candidatus Nealsonbacteria bacterium]|nr:50S ribosomal protein L4 [Candidatus Nealsonbacteria bacterium]
MYMKQKVYNQQGKEVGEVTLPKEIFEKEVNADLLHQVVVSQTSNKRQVVAHAKGRGEVSGGGRKPWRQKGTGRARHGSIRSPIWVGGGVTFGPTKDRNFKKSIPKKMKKAALFMVLSAKAKEGCLIVLDSLDIEKPKTKLMSEILNKLPAGKESSLLALPKMEEKIIRASRNIPYLEVTQARNLNSLKLLSAKYLILPKESIEVITETFLGKKSKAKKEKVGAAKK